MKESILVLRAQAKMQQNWTPYNSFASETNIEWVNTYNKHKNQIY